MGGNTKKLGCLHYGHMSAEEAANASTAHHIKTGVDVDVDVEAKKVRMGMGMPRARGT